MIIDALDNLRLTWNILSGELKNTIGLADKAKTAKEVFSAQFWFDAACNEWQIIIESTSKLNTIQTTTHHIKN